MNFRKMTFSILTLFFVNCSLLFSQDKNDKFTLKVIPKFETGFLGINSHKYRSGSESDGNTLFDFVKQGGQDILFPYTRFTLDNVLGDKHHITFLYQPLTINTKSIAGRNSTGSVQIDGVDFGTDPINITYGFDFYRVSYSKDFIDGNKTEVSPGISLQIRNANIVFESEDGTKRVVQNNVGLVPILKLKVGHWFNPLFGFEFDTDGFYASSAIFNGASREFEGWIWDSSLSLKTKIDNKSTGFLTLRTIGGGASGKDAYDNVSATKATQDETYNSLSTFSLTLGFSYEL